MVKEFFSATTALLIASAALLSSCSDDDNKQTPPPPEDPGLTMINTTKVLITATGRRPGFTTTFSDFATRSSSKTNRATTQPPKAGTSFSSTSTARQARILSRRRYCQTAPTSFLPIKKQVR